MTSKVFSLGRDGGPWEVPQWFLRGSTEGRDLQRGIWGTWSSSGPLSFVLTRKILIQFVLLDFSVILYLKSDSAA